MVKKKTKAKVISKIPRKEVDPSIFGDPKESGIDLIGILMTLWKGKQFIVIIFFTFVTATAIRSFVMTPVYKATTLAMPIASSPNVPILGVNPSQGWRQADNDKKILTILQSRTIKDYVIKNLNLMDEFFEGYKRERALMTDARKKLEKIVHIDYDAGMSQFRIDAYYKDPTVARDIVNGYVKEAQKILKEKSLTATKFHRRQIEERLQFEKERLEKTQEELGTFRKQNRIIDQEYIRSRNNLVYPELLKARIQLEGELRSLAATLGNGHPRIISIKQQIRSLNREIAKLTRLLPSQKLSPEKARKFTDLNMNIQNSQVIMGILKKSLEQAKYEEARDHLYLQVIDPAIVPEQRFSPKRKKMIIIAAFFSIFFGILIVFLIDWVENAWGYKFRFDLEVIRIIILLEINKRKNKFFTIFRFKKGDRKKE
ncbi:MAG: hypothetical protein GY754_40740 [bacterium]|nr:hypothetical protein [bacterium]